jgi:hypothetical protein
MKRIAMTATAAAFGLLGALAGGQQAEAAACATSDVSLTIGSTVYNPTSCRDGIAQGGGPTTETNALQSAFGLSGFAYLDKSDDPSTPVGLGGITFAVTPIASGTINNGSWTVTWTEAPGAPNLPAIVELLVGLFAGNTASGYRLENVLLPITPNSGTGTFDINFTNNGGQQPNLSHLLLAGKFISSPTNPNPGPVPEPATLALLGAGLVGLGLARRRRRTA